MKQCLLVLLNFSLLLFATSSHAEGKLIFSVVEGVSASKILQEAYSRIGIQIEILRLPAERALMIADEGKIDGDVNRVASIAKDYPNLVKVPVPLFFVDIVAFTKSTEIAIKGWDSLRPYKIATLRGLKIAEQGLENFEYVSVPDFDPIIRMLERGRVDIAVLPREDGIKGIKELGITSIRVIEPPLIRVELYHFLHNKHKSIVPEITASLDKMREEGLIEKLIREELSPRQ